MITDYITKILRFLIKRKYWAVLAVFLFVWLFADDNNIFQYIKVYRHNQQLLSQKRQLQELIRRDSIRLYQLLTDDQTFEQFARQTYFYHRPNEIVFVIKEKKP